MSGVVASAFTSRTVWCPSTQILYYLSAERTTLPLLISSYIAKFLDPSSGYSFVVLGIHATRYNLRCLGSCRPGFRYSAPLSSLGFRPRFSIMFKLLRFHSLLANNAHTRVLLRMSLLYRVTRHARHCRYTIHGHIHVTSSIPVSPCPRRHPIASLIRIWSSSRVYYSRCFVGQAQSYFGEIFFGFGVQVQGNPAGGEGIALSLCCGLGTRPGRGGHSSREGRNVKSKRRRIEGVKGVEIPRSARMS